MHRSMKRNKNPRNNPYIYGQLIYNKGAKICNGERTVSSIFATPLYKSLLSYIINYTIEIIPSDLQVCHMD